MGPAPPPGPTVDAPRATPPAACLAKGILLTPKATITERGGTRAFEGKMKMTPAEVLVNLWQHECERVFCDKLATNKVSRGLLAPLGGACVLQAAPGAWHGRPA